MDMLIISYDMTDLVLRLDAVQTEFIPTVSHQPWQVIVFIFSTNYFGSHADMICFIKQHLLNIS